MDALLREITAYFDSVIPQYPGGVPVGIAAAKCAVIVRADEVSLQNGAWAGPHAEFLKKVCEKGIGIALTNIELRAMASGDELEDGCFAAMRGQLRGFISFGVLPPRSLCADAAHGTVLKWGGLPFLLTLPLAEAESAEGKRMLWQDLKIFLSAK